MFSPFGCPAVGSFLQTYLSPGALTYSALPQATLLVHVLRAKAFIAACPVCACGKSSHLPLVGLLNLLDIPRRPWSHITVDFVTGLPSLVGNNIILTVVDRFSKAAYFIPLSTIPSATETGDLLVWHIFGSTGSWGILFQTEDPNSLTRYVPAFCAAMGASVSLSSGYHPKSNSQAERANQSLENALRCVVAWNPAS